MISSIRARLARACMTAGAGAIVVVAAAAGNRARATLSTCTGGTAQQWQVRSNGNIANVQSGRCLDAPGHGTGNGTQLQIYDCVARGQSNQQWSLGWNQSELLWACDRSAQAD
jgi:Ricin-type beta-trefoil lectin domain